MKNFLKYRLVKAISKSSLVFCVLGALLLGNTLYAQDKAVFQKEVSLPGQNNSIYQILNQISRQTGYFFIYDSHIIDSDKNVRIRRGKYSIGELLETMLDDASLSFRVLEKYIIIYRRKPYDEKIIVSDTIKETQYESTLIIRGKTLDAANGKALPYATITVKGRALGVTSNQDGVFNIRIPVELIDDTLRISYVGYKSRIIPVQLLLEGKHEIYLDLDLISLQEVIITYYNPYEVLRKALEAKTELYPRQPSHHTSFYREGAFKGDLILNYSEAIFRINKTAYHSQADDQVMLLKSRNITNLDIEDTLMLKLKAGIKSTLDLDVMKTLPEFLMVEYLGDYKLKAAGIVAFESGVAYAIEFEEADHVREPLYRGVIYIDRQTLAVLKVDFEVHTSYLRKHERRFIPRRSPDHITRIQSMRYSVQYRYWEGTYHLNHVRGDVDIRIRRKNRLFGNNYNVFFEMAVVNIDTLRTDRFRRRETLNTRTVFSDQNFIYDHDFWKDYNIILPEKRISEALKEMNLELENLIEE